jgi:serine/threonine protein kinase
MSTKIGHFEILSELSKSPTATIYKANDPESGQTIALKAIQLSAFEDGAEGLLEALVAECEKAKGLSSSNITPVTGAGEIEGQFCAAMEYVQGNSIATMLARKEGFSIWDLLDIGRQLCGGLDYAASQNVVHYSLEPAKIMCGWDGTVRILSFGVSSIGNWVQHVSEGLPSIIHYMSPEQVQGHPMDGRSNIFSLGAMFYEMVTERKAFDRDDVESLRQSIIESTPTPPIHVNPKVHPLLSDLIMKALAKDPAERYQNGRELLDDLEKCKESKPAAAAKKAEAPKGLIAPAKPKVAAPAKPAAPVAAKPAPAPVQPKPVSKPAPVAQSSPAKPKSVVTPVVSAPEVADARSTKLATRLATPKAAAAAAGVGGNAAQFSPEVSDDVPAEIQEQGVDELDLSNQFITSCVKATLETAQPNARMSAAVADEPEVETFAPEAPEFESPKIAVDPMMAERGPSGSSGVSFSEMTELPPLKEAYVPPPPPQATYQPVPTTTTVTAFDGNVKAEEKPKVQPREVAEKAIKEIKNVPPKLMLYALSGAGILILLIGIGFTLYIHSLNGDDDSSASRPTPAADATPQPAASEPAPRQLPAVAVQPARTSESDEAPAQPAANSKSRNAKKKAAAPVAAVIIPGQMAVDSTPQGAQVQVDGKTDASWVTPFALTNLQPGAHSITVSKAGYSTDTRTLNVTSGNRATTVVHLAQLMATLIVKSEPAGANIYVDGRDVGAKTPAQVSVDKGQHVVLVRMMGYIDETMNSQFALGQTFNFAPTLRPLGNTDNIKTVGKMSKLFGGKGAQAGQATVSIRTQPKGAQIAINQHMLDKGSPVDILLDPGNYEVDITLSGYAPVHKIITADKGGKAVVDEVLQKQ